VLADSRFREEVTGLAGRCVVFLGMKRFSGFAGGALDAGPAAVERFDALPACGGAVLCCS
jgi:hypothetical protein